MDKYAHTQRLIASGYWSVNAEAGYLVGSRGKVMGCVVNGYVVLTVRPNGTTPRNVLAHRVIWETQHGPIPIGLQINHINGCKTDNRLSNLELVTPKENIHHAWRTGLSSSAKGELAHRAKLTAEQVKSIREMIAQGATQASVADDFGISQSHVSRLVHRRQWAA